MRGMAAFYYRGNDGQTEGPVGETDIKALYQSGEITGDTMVIKEGAKKWRRYEEAFWTPPLIAEEGGSALNWKDAQAKGVCPLCESLILVTQKSLAAKKGVRCPNCNQRFAAKALKEAEPADAYVYERSFWELLFSMSGRVGIKEFWLFGVLLPVLLGAGVYFMPGLVEEDAAIWSAIVLAASSLPASVKRWHDHNQSGWVIAAFVGACFVPGLAFLTTPAYFWFTGFRKGKDEVNQFGPPTERIRWAFK